MKIRSFFLLSGIVAALFSCAKEEISTDLPADAAQINISLSIADGSEKAVISDGGFDWQVGDVVSWIGSDGNKTSTTLKAENITGGNTAVFTAAIPGLASGDVQGYFAVNSSSTGEVNFSAGTLSDGKLTVSQPAAGEINPSNLFLLSGRGYTTLKKGQTNVAIEMNLAGSVIAVRPFTSKYNSEKVKSVKIYSLNNFVGAITYNHSYGVAGDIASNAAKSYKVSLATPQPLSGVTSKETAKSVYFTVPAGQLREYNIVVRTDVAKYLFTSKTDIELGENILVSLPLNLDKATRTLLPTGTVAVNLTDAMISTNSPMQYVAYDFTPQGEWGPASGWKNRDISEVSGARVERETKWDRKANLWDNNPATSYHTNFDLYPIGYSWDFRPDVLVPNNYIQIGLTAPLKKFKLYFQNSDSGAYLGLFNVSVSADGSSFSNLSGCPFTVPSANYGAEVTLDNLDAGSNIKYIRIQPQNGFTNDVGDFNMSAGYFGIAELGLWNLEGGADDEEDDPAPEEEDEPGPGPGPQPGTDPIPVTLAASMISTNNPMQYATYDYTPQNPGDWVGYNRVLSNVSGASAEREAKWGRKTNLWDGDASTSFHTNFDVYVEGESWGMRGGALVPDNYIQISLTAPLKKFKLYFQNTDTGAYLGSFNVSVSADGSSFSNLSGCPFTVPSANYGAEVTLDNLDAGSNIKYIRIQPQNGFTNPVGDINQRAGYFGLAELKLWCLDGSYNPVDPGEDEEIRTIDSPSTAPFLPRRWKSGMNVSSNAWYKYWSDPSGIWNNGASYLWLPNCTHYCMGRAAEISKRPIFSNHELFSSGYPNAQNWYANSKWSKGSTPRLGAICVWNGGQYGHVATVEKVNDDGTIDISQSSYQEYNRTFDNPKYFEYVRNLKCVVGYVTAGIGWAFSGYVYNPYVNDIRQNRNSACSQIDVFVDGLTVRNDNMVQTGETVLPGIYNIYEYRVNSAASHDWVKIADQAWIPVDSDWNTIYY